jgi:hypothetical protein
MVANQRTITGPNSLPTRWVPYCWDEEQHDENGHRNRHDVGLGKRRGDVQTLGGAEDRDGGRDHAVAVEQRRAEDAKQHQHWLDHIGPAARAPRRQERVNARMPPSPWLSARMTMAMYLSDTTMKSA